jgi:HK97 family phage prohead protease
MKGLLEYKKNSFGAVKDIDIKNRVITGYLSSFNTTHNSGDQIREGAYKKTLQERRDQIMFLNQHNFAQPHGKFAILQEDKDGLYFESNPLIDTTYSQDAMKLYEAGIISEHSVGFITMNKEYKNNNRIITEMKLYEGSNVTIGDDPNTPFMGFKSLTISETNDKIGIILKFFKAGTVTDDTFQLLEIALKDLQKHAYEIGLNTKKEVIKIEPSAVDIINAYLSK